DTFRCELSGNFVDEFRKILKNACVGLPIVVLQFVKINRVQGLLILCLDKVRIFLPLSHHVAMPTSSIALDFKKEYPFISIKTNPELSFFILNVRIAGVIDLHPWWHCLCMVVEDESGSTYINAYDHVLHSVAGLKTNNLERVKDFYINVVKSIFGKSVQFVVEKTSHEPHDTEAAFELLSVTADNEIIQRFVARGLCNTPSKVG
ncbi:replication factor A protein, partial [Trifolium medium]|nr:replication factor A protein [Trifolium medium]